MSLNKEWNDREAQRKLHEAEQVRADLELEQLRLQLNEARRLSNITLTRPPDPTPLEQGQADIDMCIEAARKLREIGARSVRINNFVVEFDPLMAGPPPGLAAAIAAQAQKEPEPATEEDYLP